MAVHDSYWTHACFVDTMNRVRVMYGTAWEQMIDSKGFLPLVYDKALVQAFFMCLLHSVGTQERLLIDIYVCVT